MPENAATPPVLAASVSYRPAAEVPAELEVHRQSGTRVDYYDLSSLDGRTGLAVHLVPDRPDRTAPLVISVHGSGGSIASQPVLALSRGLAERGYPVLAINTRQSGASVNTDNFYATVRDVEAAYWMGRHLGHTRIALHGHSLGTSQVQFFAATHWHSDLVGLVLTGMFADLPWKSRHLLINDEARYQQLTDEAVAYARAGEFDATLGAGMPWLGNRTTPVTAQHFLTYRRVGLAGARSVEWATRIPYPVLLVRDEHDSVIQDFEPGWLAAALRDGLCPDVTSVSLPSEPGTEGHRFDGSHPALVDTVAGWLSERTTGRA